MLCESVKKGTGARTPAAVAAIALALALSSSAFSAEVGISEKLGATADLDAVLWDEQGNNVTLRKLVDKPTILTLNFFRCTGICTPLLNGVSDALNEIGMSPGRDFQVITVSFDPRDTPDIASQKQKNYLSEMKRPVPPGAWRFLTGEAQATQRLADSVGFGFEQQGDQFLHPGAIMILTPDGVVSRYIYGIRYLPADLEMALKEASGGKVRPTISRVLSFCYSYDPQGRGYVLSVTKVSGVLLLLATGVFVGILVFRRRPGSVQ